MHICCIYYYISTNIYIWSWYEPERLIDNQEHVKFSNGSAPHR